MYFEKELQLGILIKRYKRFLADVKLDDGATVTAHVPNTGSMKSTSDPGSRVALIPNDGPGRKLKWTLELVQAPKGYWVGVNTLRTNRIVEEAIAAGRLRSLSVYETFKREVKFGLGSRLDFMLESERGRCYVEVKNVTYKHGSRALFPDAVTARGAKHLRDLEEAVRLGHRGVIFFLVNRGDCAAMEPAWRIDPDYGRALLRSRDRGVEVMAYRTAITNEAIELDKRIRVSLRDPAG